jgi:uncharacterized protein (AIM24 family)
MTATATAAYTCPYCRHPSEGTGRSCPSCGAPVDVTLRVTSGGWTEVPPMADMTRIQAGRSSVEVSGSSVPVADWDLAADESVWFPHHVLRWQEPSVQLDTYPLERSWTRMRAGLPVLMLTARGPGHIAFSHHAPGELVVLPVDPGSGIDVCQDHLVMATDGVGYDWYDSDVWYATDGEGAADEGAGVGLLKMGMHLAGDVDGDRSRNTSGPTWHYPVGRHVDRFTTGERPGLVLIGASGAAFTRDLAEGESILVKPPALLFKDPTVAMQLHVEYPAAGMKLWRTWGNRYLWLRLWGPGRVGLESGYATVDDPGTTFHDMSQATQHAW